MRLSGYDCYVPMILVCIPNPLHRRDRTRYNAPHNDHNFKAATSV